MSVEVTRLPSGLTVVTDAMPHLETASLGVWVGAGSRDELSDEHGISHLLEHMAFKGTKLRTARQIAEEIEAVGGDLNAATSIESTTYYARVLKAEVPVGTAIATLQGQTFTIGADLQITDRRGRTSQIIGTDVFTSNGVIHVIDRVLLPAA